MEEEEVYMIVDGEKVVPHDEFEYAYYTLCEIFGNVIPLYDGDETFPFACSYQVPHEGLYIDFNVSTERDDRFEKQKKFAKENKVKYCYFWGLEEFIPFVNATMDLEFTEEELRKEYKRYLNSTPSTKLASSHNKLVRFFQQYNLYQNERYLFGDFWTRYRLFRNREKYINVRFDEIDPTIIINGFKIAGIWYGYSMFNPNLAKWFIKNYNLENCTCYDPCGGWGHRLIGIAPYVKKYIYNDLSDNTVEATKAIAEFCGLNNVDFYNEDGGTFTPEDDYECMFTCPPYYANNRNTESYQCDDFSSQEEYDKFLHGLYDKYEKKDSCKIFGLVIREDMLPEDLKDKVSYSVCISKDCRTHYNRTAKSNKKNFYEYVYVFRKEEDK